MFKEMKFRVENPEHSQKIQSALASMGYKWMCGFGDIQYTDAKFLFTHSKGGCGTISYSNSEHTFKSGQQVEHTLKEIITYELLPVPDELVELNGKLYKKQDLEEALAKLQPVE